MENPQVERAPYGRQVERASDSKLHSGYAGETYYGQPVLHPPHYGQLVATYLFLGGLAGASQLIATVAELCGGQKNNFIVRAGRYLALGGVVSGPMFLIADLRTPERWYNMLRIFRRSSPMSIGSWTLAGFGTLSAATSGFQFLADRLGRPVYQRAARAASLPATAAGALVATYTGTLLGATSVPFWSRVSRSLAALFGVSATATSTAALSLAANASGAPEPATKALTHLAVITAGAELLASTALERQWERENLAGPLMQEPLATAYRVGYKGLGIAAPLAIHGLRLITRRPSRRWSVAAAVATLAGGYLLRSIIVHAGKESAKRPEDYFRTTQRG